MGGKNLQLIINMTANVELNFKGKQIASQLNEINAHI